MEHEPNPIFKANHPNYEPPEKFDTISGMWYFWDETWSSIQGPFQTEQEAKEELAKYSETL